MFTMFRPVLLSCLHPLGDEKIATVGLYGAKKVIAFTKTVLKSRKGATEDASEDVAGESSAVEATKDDDADADADDEDQGGDEQAAQVQVQLVKRRDDDDGCFVAFYQFCMFFLSRHRWGVSSSKLVASADVLRCRASSFVATCCQGRGWAAAARQWSTSKYIEVYEVWIGSRRDKWLSGFEMPVATRSVYALFTQHLDPNACIPGCHGCWLGAWRPGATISISIAIGEMFVLWFVCGIFVEYSWTHWLLSGCAVATPVVFVAFPRMCKREIGMFGVLVLGLFHTNFIWKEA